MDSRTVSEMSSSSCTTAAVGGARTTSPTRPSHLRARGGGLAHVLSDSNPTSCGRLQTGRRAQARTLPPHPSPDRASRWAAPAQGCLRIRWMLDCQNYTAAEAGGSPPSTCGSDGTLLPSMQPPSMYRMTCDPKQSWLSRFELSEAAKPSTHFMAPSSRACHLACSRCNSWCNLES
jgi:hypothetical protein